MKKLTYLSLCLFILLSCSSKQFLESQDTLKTPVQSERLLVNGPMVGYSTMQEVAIWIQGVPKSKYRLVYQLDDGKEHISDVITLGGQHDNTAILKARDLEPGEIYSYRVELANQKPYITVGTGKFQTQPLWQWRSDPPPFSFAFGSCVYINEPKFDRPGTPYGGDYHIFSSIHELNPDFMIWGGDNTYLREADWNSMTGIWNRYTHSRDVPEMKDLLANTHHYGIWDDHDYGPNNSDRSFFMKDSTYKAFTKFWANPSYGIDGKNGITSKFQWNDCEFFLLDNRYFRTPNDRKTGEKYILGEHQVDWLIDNLINSKASFKFIVVGGQVVSNVALYENHATFAEERNHLLNLIHDEGIKNVIFLTGDRHHSEISKLTLDQEQVIYDITSSPLTSGSHDSRDEGNGNQIEGSLISQRNFALFTVSGEWGDRQINIRYYDVNGDELFSYEIAQVK